MKEQIKELRVEIDGLAQLVNNLNGVSLIDVSLIPSLDGWDTKKWLKELEEYGIMMTDQQTHQKSKELEKTIDSLYLAKAWLGKVLQELGETTTYANDGNRKTVEDIEPTSDTYKPKEYEVSDYSQLYNPIEKVDWLRQEIEKIAKSEYISSMTYQPKTRLEAIARTNTYNHLTEARFWLGFELTRVRDESTSK